MITLEDIESAADAIYRYKTFGEPISYLCMVEVEQALRIAAAVLRDKQEGARGEIAPELVLTAALQAGFMVSERCGQEEGKTMPVSDGETLLDFYCALHQTIQPSHVEKLLKEGE